jgi:CDP-diacylglycerol--serine O-phosphatidyltransferase
MIRRATATREAESPRRRRARRRRGVVLRTIAIVPTLMTLGNALCGFAAIFIASRYTMWVADKSATVGEALDAAGRSVPELPLGLTPLTAACIFIFAAMLLDGLDGQVARITRSTSDLGEQLDSMADMVSFGVAPAFVALMLIGIETPFGGGRGDTYFDRLGLVAALIYVACAALRLARFNIELGSEEQPDHNAFKGLPSPGAAGTVTSLVLLHQHFIADDRPNWVVNAASMGMIVVLLLTAFAMVSQLRYVHVLNRFVRGRAPFATVVKGVVLGLFLVIEFQATLAAALILYALSAPVVEGWRKLWSRPGPRGAQ